MQAREFHKGQLVTWRYTPSGGYAYTQHVSGVVRATGRHRVTIEVPLSSGGTKRVSVDPANLKHRTTATDDRETP